jgi:drug/metabolite transporter (DMT)-like permease
MDPPWRVALALLAVWTIWSSTYLGIRIVVLEVPPMLSSGARFALAGAGLLAIGMLRGERFPRAIELVRATPAGVLLFAGGNGLVAVAERTASSGAGALAAALSPVWAALISYAFGDRPTRRQWLGFALGFAGVALLVSGDALPDRRSAIALAIAPVCWAGGTVLVRRMPSRPSLQLFMGGISMLLIGLIAGEHVVSISQRAFAAWVYLTVVGSMLAFTAYAYLVRNASTTVAMSYAYVNPVLAVLLGAALGGEHVGRGLILSAALVVLAVILIVRRR